MQKVTLQKEISVETPEITLGAEPLVVLVMLAMVPLVLEVYLNVMNVTNVSVHYSRRNQTNYVHETLALQHALLNRKERR